MKPISESDFRSPANLVTGPVPPRPAFGWLARVLRPLCRREGVGGLDPRLLRDAGIGAGAADRAAAANAPLIR